MVKRKIEPGLRAVIVTFHPSALLWKGVDTGETVSAPACSRDVGELDRCLKRLGHVQGPRSYLAEFVGLSPANHAPMWRPVLRLRLTAIDQDEASDAPGREEVGAWFETSLDAVRLDDYGSGEGPKPG